jgi:hypothetical protein
VHILYDPALQLPFAAKHFLLTNFIPRYYKTHKELVDPWQVLFILVQANAEP